MACQVPEHTPPGPSPRQCRSATPRVPALIAVSLEQRITATANIKTAYQQGPPQTDHSIFESRTTKSPRHRRRLLGGELLWRQYRNSLDLKQRTRTRELRHADRSAGWRRRLVHVLVAYLAVMRDVRANVYDVIVEFDYPLEASADRCQRRFDVSDLTSPSISRKPKRPPRSSRA